MFTITNKIRTIVALSAVGAVLGSSAVASAATVVHHRTSVKVVAAHQPTVHRTAHRELRRPA